MAKSPKLVKIKALKNQVWIADQCVVADRFLSRLKGLIGTRHLHEGQGLWITRCREIHMWFMSIEIDVLFIKKLQTQESSCLYEVCSARSGLSPWKIFPVRNSKASDTLELPKGTIQRCKIEEGDQICISW